MEAAKSPTVLLVTRLLLVVGLAGVMLGIAIPLGPRINFWQQQRLAKKLVAEVERSPSPRIQIVLKQVSGLGNPAIEALVTAAASERADLALAARRIIEEQLATWQIQAEHDRHFSLAEPTSMLANALAEHVGEFGAFGQQWATRLTLDIVDLAGTFEIEAAVPVLADCSTVLSSVPALGPRMLTPVEPTGEPDRVLAEPGEVVVPPLPHAQTDGPRPRSLPTIITEPSISSDLAGDSQPAEELLSSSELPRDSNWIPEWTNQPKLVVSGPQLPSEGKPSVPAAPGELVEVPSPEEQARLVESLQSLETRELVAQLTETNPFKLAAIREALVARGLAREELALAGKLFATDVAERLELVDDLTVLPARTARRWLRELLVDKDPEVRLQALTALATTNDPELGSIARDLAVRDTDRRVAELASQIMRELR